MSWKLKENKNVEEEWICSLSLNWDLYLLLPLSATVPRSLAFRLRCGLEPLFSGFQIQNPASLPVFLGENLHVEGYTALLL